MIFELLCTVIAIIVIIYLDFKLRFRFWKNMDVPFMQPSVPLGNISEILRNKTHFGYVIQNIYNQMKPCGDYCGVFFSRNPVLLVLSPEFAKTVLVRDFSYFADRGVFSNEKVDPLSANLFFLEGQKWKDIRSKITPTFTSGKLKLMFKTIFDVGEKFVCHMDKLTETSNDIEFYDLFARYTTDCISSSAFGFDAESLDNPQTEFVRMGKKVLHFSKLKALKIFFAMGFRSAAKILRIRFNDEDVEHFFLTLIRETIDQRKRTGFTRKDFLQLLIEQMKNGENDEEKLNFHEIAAQVFGFYFAGS